MWGMLKKTHKYRLRWISEELVLLTEFANYFLGILNYSIIRYIQYNFVQFFLCKIIYLFYKVIIFIFVLVMMLYSHYWLLLYLLLSVKMLFVVTLPWLTVKIYVFSTNFLCKNLAIASAFTTAARHGSWKWAPIHRSWYPENREQVFGVCSKLIYVYILSLYMYAYRCMLCIHTTQSASLNRLNPNFVHKFDVHSHSYSP